MKTTIVYLRNTHGDIKRYEVLNGIKYVKETLDEIDKGTKEFLYLTIVNGNTLTISPKLCSTIEFMEGTEIGSSLFDKKEGKE